MSRKLIFNIVSITAACVIIVGTSAQTQTVGLFLNEPASHSGYTLFTPNSSTTTYLIDPYGRLVHSWASDHIPRNSVYLLENGVLLRPGMKGGVPNTEGVQKIDWDGTVLWDFVYSDTTVRQHHDVHPLPNGNVLILAWEMHTPEEAIAAGRDSANVNANGIWAEQIVEVEPNGLNGGTIVWKWSLWDHLIQDHDSTKDNYGIVENHPELVDVNWNDNAVTDWIHANALSYDPDLDQVVINSRTFSEFWVVDHNTTTAEAAGHSGGHNGVGGDIIYRWGNPIVYRSGDSADQRLFQQHDTHWIPPGLPGSGNILVFNNGTSRNFSTVDEIASVVDDNGMYPQLDSGRAHGPSDALWSYIGDPPEDFFSFFISGAQRLPNGNTLICAGASGVFFEVTTDGEMVWKYVNPVKSTGPIVQGLPPSGNSVFRCYRYNANYPGLLGKDLTPGAPIERYPITIAGTAHAPLVPTDHDSVYITTTMLADSGTITLAELSVDTGDGFFVVPLLDDGHHSDGLPGDNIYGAGLPPLSEGSTVRYYVTFEDNLACHVVDPPNPPTTAYRFTIATSCGNVDGIAGVGGPTDVADLTYLVAYLFQGGPPLPDINTANLDGITGVGGPVDVADLSYLVAYLFQSGPAPVC